MYSGQGYLRADEIVSHVIQGLSNDGREVAIQLAFSLVSLTLTVHSNPPLFFSFATLEIE